MKAKIYIITNKATKEYLRESKHPYTIDRVMRGLNSVQSAKSPFEIGLSQVELDKVKKELNSNRDFFYIYQNNTDKPFIKLFLNKELIKKRFYSKKIILNGALSLATELNFNILLKYFYFRFVFIKWGFIIEFK